jgi:hypothetical protein
MTPTDTLLTIVSLVLAIMFWSYALFGDNYAFAIGEAMFIGGNAANSTFALLKTLQTGTINPILAGNITLLIAFILGATAFTRLTRYRWAARYSTAVLSGVGVGVIFGQNLRSQILAGITETIGYIDPSATVGSKGVVGAIFDFTPVSIGGYSIPQAVISLSWIFAAVMLVVMVLTFSYSRLIAGPFFNKGSRLEWVSKLGRIFIMIMLGHISCKTLLGDSLDSLIIFVQANLKRNIDALITGLPPT